MSRRRNLLAGAAALAGASLPTSAAPPAVGANDRHLLALGMELRAAKAAEEAVVRRECAIMDSGGEGAFAAAEDAAFAAWTAVVQAMADTPADGLAGLAVKAAQACHAITDGVTSADGALVESIRADLARLLPGLVG